MKVWTKKEKKSHKTGFLFQSGPNLMSFAFNMGVLGVQLGIFLQGDFFHPQGPEGFMQPCLQVMSVRGSPGRDMRLAEVTECRRGTAATICNSNQRTIPHLVYHRSRH